MPKVVEVEIRGQKRRPRNGSARRDPEIILPHRLSHSPAERIDFRIRFKDKGIIDVDPHEFLDCGFEARLPYVAPSGDS